MNNARINNELDLAYPDGFGEMRADELTRYFSSPDNRWGVYNADKHIILSVSWAKAGFRHLLTDADLYLSGMEARMRRSLLNYQRISSFPIKIASKKAQGIRFEYRVNDARIVHVADLIVFKHKKKFYAIHFITRKATAADDRLALREVLRSITVH